MISWAKIAKAAMIGLALTLSALIGSKINLFGFEEVTNNASDDIWQRVSAGGYGDSQAGQDLIRIVHIDETGLTALRNQGWTAWPPGYANLAYMIDDVLQGGGAPPRAVFADLIITGQSGLTPAAEAEFAVLVETLARATRADVWGGAAGCRADALIKIACIVEAGGTPVVLAKPDPLDQGGFTRVQIRLDEAAVLAPVLVRTRAYPLANSYDGIEPPGVRGFDLSPAAAMYAAHCLNRLHETGRNVCALAGISEAAAAARAALAGDPVPADAGAALTAAWREPVAVVWGDRQPARQAEIAAATSSGPAPECREQASGLTRLIEQTFMAHGAGAGDRQACAYTFSIGYDRLVAGYGLSSETDYPFILADRLVMIGSHMRNSDWAPSPVHGQLPGVHYHAMALDNLVELGPAYRRVDSRFINTDDLLKSVLTFILLFGVITAVMARNGVIEHLFPDREGRLPLWASGIYYGALALGVFAITLLVTWLGAGLWNRAVINWLGILSVALGTLVMAARLTFVQDAGRPLRWTETISAKMKFDTDALIKARKTNAAAEAAAPPATPE